MVEYKSKTRNVKKRALLYLEVENKNSLDKLLVLLLIPRKLAPYLSLLFSPTIIVSFFPIPFPLITLFSKIESKSQENTALKFYAPFSYEWQYLSLAFMLN